MGFNISSMKSDPKLSAEGVWTEDLGGGLRLRVARANNSRYQAEIATLCSPYTTGGLKPQINVPSDKQEEIINLALAKHVLLGWENLEDDDGPVEYSVEKAFEYLSTVPEFRTAVLVHANNMELFRGEQVKIDSGNSHAASSGTGSGPSEPNS